MPPVSQPEPPVHPASAPVQFTVRLSRPWWQGGFSDNTPGLRGVARLVCTGHTVELHTRARSRSWPAGYVFNVLRDGCRVSFRVLGDDGLVDHVAFWLDDVSLARAARAALPGQSTVHALQGLQHHHLFQDRLDAAHPAPRWTRRLIGLNGLVFLLVVASGGGLIDVDPRWLVAWGSNFAPLTLGGQPWRLGTSMFLHGGLMHLGFNMWALANGGRFAEQLFGPRRFLLIYLGAGLAGSLTSALWNPAVNSVGASGAIMGVLGAILAWFLRSAAGVPASVVRQQRNNGLLILLVNLGYGAVQPGIDNAAHLGGLCVGMGLGWLLAQPLPDVPPGSGG